MSRVYEALQKSQGENPSASPLVPGQPEACARRSDAVPSLLASRSAHPRMRTG